MPYKRIIISAVIVLAAIASYRPLRLFHEYYLSVCPVAKPEKQDDFSMHIEQVDIENYSTIIEQFEAEYQIQVVRTITYGEKDYSIYQIERTNEDRQRRLLVFAATHGNEFASALVIPELLSDIVDNDIYDSWSIRIITPVNPVGLEYQSRYNENGCDINRDFHKFQTIEAQIQRDAIQTFKPDIIVSLHEGPQDGFFAIATSGASADLRNAISVSLSEHKIMLAKRSFLGIPLAKEGIMYEGKWISSAKKIFGIHTLGRYAESQGISVITTESSWIEMDMEKRIVPHIITIRAIVQNTPD